jgi:hypothetical protein
VGASLNTRLLNRWSRVRSPPGPLFYFPVLMRFIFSEFHCCSSCSCVAVSLSVSLTMLECATTKPELL